MPHDPAPAPVPAIGGRGRRLWLDVSAGVAGDMLLGALVDAGATLTALQAAVDAVIPGTVRLSARTVKRAGMRATKVDVELLADDLPHRHWTDIRAMLDDAPLGAETKARALAVFGRLAEAEARAHGIDRASVHFHEVGSWDSIADVVGTCAALTELGVSRISAGPVALGSGQVRTAHGEIPVPVPAVLELSAGWQVRSGGQGELATPTGMALVTALAMTCEALPTLVVQRVGVGAGTRDTEGRPNVVRVVLGTPDGAPPDEQCVVLEANVDDLDPRLWPGVLSALMADGAADAWLTPILMKKGRPAHTLSVLSAPERATSLREAMFALVPTLGVRESTLRRTVLERTWRTVEVADRPVRIKLGHAGGTIRSATPEFEDVVRVAGELDRPVRGVLDHAVAAAVEAGLAVGRSIPE